MKESEKKENLYQILAIIRSQVNVMQKDGKGYNYSYVKEESILSKITGLMDKYNISLVPCIMKDTTQVTPYSYSKTRVSKQGDIYQDTTNEILVSAEMEWMWVNNENPSEKIIIPWSMVGQQSDASQAFGAALTYSTRYFLLKFFNIATSNDDPDKLRGEQRQAVANADRAIASALIEEAHKKITQYVVEKEENKEAIKQLASKYAKEGNYFTIADPLVAQEFLEAVQKTTSTDESQGESQDATSST